MTEFVLNELVENGNPMTREDIIAELKVQGDAVPDFTWRAKDIATDHDRVTARMFDKGTPAKGWFGVQPTGTTVEHAEYSFHRVRDGRFYEKNYLVYAQMEQDFIAGRRLRQHLVEHAAIRRIDAHIVRRDCTTRGFTVLPAGRPSNGPWGGSSSSPRCVARVNHDQSGGHVLKRGDTLSTGV